MGRGNNKRAWQGSDRRRYRDNRNQDKDTGPPPEAFTRAYEAQLTDGNGREDDLIRWAGEGPELWLDRHDILHMLPELDTAPPSPTQSDMSSSWSLPDDAESLFDVSGDEAEEEHKRKKRQAWVNDLREARLREREKEDEEEEEEQRRIEATRQDESPPPDIRKLMEHTAKSLAGSANPVQLEARITARHGNTDPRFAFLRPGGPFSSVWEKIRAETIGLNITSAIATESPKEKPKTGGGLLAGYGSDSDSGSDSDPPPRPQDEPPPPPPGSPPPPPPGSPPLPPPPR